MADRSSGRRWSTAVSAAGGFAASAVGGPDDREPLHAPFALLPVDGVSISLLGSPVGAETVSASSAASARWDEIQLDLGEGPVWSAAHAGEPVLVPDVRAVASSSWPIALPVLQAEGVGAVFALPMLVGHTCIGTVTLYGTTPSDLPSRSIDAAVGLARATAVAVLHRAVERAEAEHPGESTPGEYSRREVHQAVGMIAAQTGATTPDAFLLLRAVAFAAGRTVRDLAVDVLDRLIDFGSPDALDSPERTQP